MERIEGAAIEALTIVKLGSRMDGAILSDKIIALMVDILPCQSKDCVMSMLGISSNTWVKIKRREPIRLSTAEQLVRRIANRAVRLDTASSGAHQSGFGQLDR